MNAEERTDFGSRAVAARLYCAVDAAVVAKEGLRSCEGMGCGGARAALSPPIFCWASLLANDDGSQLVELLRFGGGECAVVDADIVDAAGKIVLLCTP